MTYSLDFRQKVLCVKAKENLSFAAVSRRFDVGLASVARWSKDIIPQKTRDKPATKINMQSLEKDIETYPDAYQYERAERLGVSKSGVWHALKRLKVTYKKNSQTSQSRPRKTLCILPNHSTLPN